MSTHLHKHYSRMLPGLAVAGLLWLSGPVARADERAALVADRAAVERVYFSHRIGQHQTFEQTISSAELERLVRGDLDRERILKNVYGVTVTEAMVQAEVRRIDTTTRAPDVLVELKAALGNDPGRFGRTVARPIIVERELRQRFNNDGALHAGLRSQAEKQRADLLSARTAGAGAERLLATLKHDHPGQVAGISWLLTPRPVEQREPVPDLMEIKKRYGPEAQVVSTPGDPTKVDELYLSDLPAELQQVLQVQLQKAGDVSAVIETPDNFLLYVARGRTATRLEVACFALPKCDYDSWLREQTEKLEK